MIRLIINSVASSKQQATISNYGYSSTIIETSGKYTSIYATSTATITTNTSNPSTNTSRKRTTNSRRPAFSSGYEVILLGSDFSVEPKTQTQHQHKVQTKDDEILRGKGHLSVFT